MSVSWSDRQRGRFPVAAPARRGTGTAQPGPSAPRPQTDDRELFIPAERSLAKDWPKPLAEPRDCTLTQDRWTFYGHALAFALVGFAVGWDLALRDFRDLPVGFVLAVGLVLWLRPRKAQR